MREFSHMVPIVAQNLETQPGIANLPKRENEPTFLQPQALGRVDIGPGQVDSVTRQYKEVQELRRHPRSGCHRSVTARLWSVLTQSWAMGEVLG